MLEWSVLVILQMVHNFMMLPILFVTGFNIRDRHKYLISTGVIKTTPLEDSAVANVTWGSLTQLKNYFMLFLFLFPVIQVIHVDPST